MSKAGFATSFVETENLLKSLRVELEPGYDVLVHLFDHQGIRFRSEGVLVEALGPSDSERWEAHRGDDGAWLLSGLPSRPLVLRVTG